MSKIEYLIVQKGTKLVGLGKLGLKHLLPKEGQKKKYISKVSCLFVFVFYLKNVEKNLSITEYCPS